MISTIIERWGDRVKLKPVYSPEDLEQRVQEAGFLPFFTHKGAGMSVQECTPPELWFAPDRDGPWEWKGPVIRTGSCLYGKFFGGKCGFVRADWFPDLANVRRDGYDFDSLYEEGLAPRKDKQIYDALTAGEPILSSALKAACGYGKGGNTGFDTVMTRLQAETYAVVEDFVYRQDQFGRPYGWGVARYATPEKLFGYDTVTAAYSRSPDESRGRLMTCLRERWPEIDPAVLSRLIG